MTLPIDKLIPRTRTGAAFLYRRWRHKRYWREAAGRLSRELQIPGQVLCVEGAVSKAVKSAGGRSVSEHIQRLTLGGVGDSEFQTFTDRVAEALPIHLRAELPDLALPHNDREISDRFRRAVQHVIAASDIDEIANRILQNGDSAVGRRRSWTTMTITVAAGILVTGVLLGAVGDLGLDQPSGAIVGTAVGALAAGGFAITATYHTGAQVVKAKRALDRLFEALLEPNIPNFRPPNDEERLCGADLDDQVQEELARLIESAGYGTSAQPNGPPRQETVYRFNLAQLDRLRKALTEFVDALEPLALDPDWEPPRRLVRGIQKIVDTEPTDTLEVELVRGATLLDAMLHGAALSRALGQAIAQPVSEQEAA